VLKGLTFFRDDDLDLVNDGRMPNPLILDADGHKMSPFYNLIVQLSVLFLNRTYE
jgi:hypothetical protein